MLLMGGYCFSEDKIKELYYLDTSVHIVDAFYFVDDYVYLISVT